MAVKTSR